MARASRLLTIWAALLALVVGQEPARAQDARSFSADIIGRGQGGVAVPAGRLRVRGERTRLETPALPDGYFLTDVAVPTAYFIRPAARLYMDARGSSRLTRLFVPVDPKDPCRAWQAMAQLANAGIGGDWQCADEGEERLGDRRALAYRVRAGDQQQFIGWVDPQLRFPLQITLADGMTYTVEALREEVQAVDLFDLPAGLRKFDPAALLERVRQSDVWVEAH
ncbi:hypothetical protein ACQR1W_02610 [Bradyrhizobium sp. HKCCYLS1011]|uniref:hypothetical protein n=1 Tax=Bradyrhizobium sp. HKCCYLS1011 TaxID=3420733 RepID=UPI003EC0B97D